MKCLKCFITADKHHRFKYFISQTTSIRFEHLSSNAKKSFVSHFKIGNYRGIP